jgi:hypothetical protein
MSSLSFFGSSGFSGFEQPQLASAISTVDVNNLNLMDEYHKYLSFMFVAQILL